MNTTNRAQAFINAILTTLPLCLAFLYLSGLTYNRFYFAAFGLNQQSLALSLYDQAAKGFAVSISNTWLRVQLLAVFALPPLAVTYTFKSNVLEHTKAIGIPLVLLLVTLCGYASSKSIGVADSNRDHSPQSALNTVDFAIGRDDYHGSLLYLKDDMLFVDRLVVGGGSPQPGVAVLKLGDVKQLRIIGRSEIDALSH